MLETNYMFNDRFSFGMADPNIDQYACRMCGEFGPHECEREAFVLRQIQLAKMDDDRPVGYDAD